ncbi:MAG: LacI family transcriptional regulator [Chloroflexi bacterium]|nr:LacI family transcriptional regulator [Chloroflexota bacterium]
MSIKKISEMTGLSTATVSHVLSGKRRVSESNREKVLLAARQIGYRPNLAARMLRTQKSNTIALVIPTDETNRNANFFYMDILLGITKKLDETDFSVLIANYRAQAESERSLRGLQVLQKQWVDGIILVPSSRNPGQLDTIREMGVPFVLVDRRVDGTDYSCVDSDNEGGAFEAVSLLARNGKTRIGLIGGGMRVSSCAARYNGYLRALKELGFDYTDEYVSLTNVLSIENGCAHAAELLKKGVDGIFVADNVLSMGAVLELNRQGVRIPDEVGIVAFDDFSWMDMTMPPLTTVKQQAYQMGYVAAEMMLRKLNGMDINEKVMLDTGIVLRKSHGNLS